MQLSQIFIQYCWYLKVTKCHKSANMTSFKEKNSECYDYYSCQVDRQLTLSVVRQNNIHHDIIVILLNL